MLQFLLDNLGTLLVSCVLALCLFAVIRHLVKNKREGRTSCGCGCANCALRGQCHPDGETPEKEN